MTGHGVSDGDMPSYSWPTPPVAQAFDALLAGDCRPEEAPAELRPVAEVLLALQAPPGRRETAGWEAALTAYREVTNSPERPGRSRVRGRRLIAPLFSARVATAAGAVAVAVLGGGVAAAYTGSLPGGLQRIAHEVFAAPSVPDHLGTPAPAGTGRAVGPSVGGSATYGLCRAYQQAEAHGSASQRSVAFRNLAKAAGGANRVDAYCAGVSRPGTSTSPPGRRVGQASSSAAASHGRKPTAPPGQAKASDSGNGNGKGSGNGNGIGNGNGGGGGNGSGNGHNKS